jgi:hypothetical protein
MCHSCTLHENAVAEPEVKQIRSVVNFHQEESEELGLHISGVDLDEPQGDSVTPEKTEASSSSSYVPKVNRPAQPSTHSSTMKVEPREESHMAAESLTEPSRGGMMASRGLKHTTDAEVPGSRKKRSKPHPVAGRCIANTSNTLR